MAEKTKQIILNVDAGPEADPEEIEKITRQLREEILELDVEAVDFVSAGEAPVKAKAGDPVAWGTLILTASVSGGIGSASAALVGMLQSWLMSQNKGRITLEIDGDKLEVEKPTLKERQQLINAWLERHSKEEKNND